MSDDWRDRAERIFISHPGDTTESLRAALDYAARELAGDAPAFTVAGLLAGEHAYFVITDALEEWAARQRDEAADSPDDLNSRLRIEWADCADGLRERVEKALSREGDPPMAARSADALAANLASLNEIVAEMTQAAADHGWTEQPFAVMVRGTLRGHSHALGFGFQGAAPGSQVVSLGDRPGAVPL